MTLHLPVQTPSNHPKNLGNRERGEGAEGRAGGGQSSGSNSLRWKQKRYKNERKLMHGRWLM